jgi:hypothetical protein
MTQHAASFDISILARPPGMIAVAGSMVGTLLAVISLFVVLYADVPWWVAGWTGACGALLVASGVWAWQRPREVVKALQLGAMAAIAGLGSSAPAFRMWIQLGMRDPWWLRVEVAAVGVGLGLLCACYLAFVAADLVRGARLEALARGEQ